MDIAIDYTGSESKQGGSPSQVWMETSVCNQEEWMSLSELSAGANEFVGMIIQSPEMQILADYVSRIAPYKTTVLIQGESGTGKELVAQALHRLGPAPSGPFVTFNCSNLIALLADAQLFGHVRGAFTDARTDSLGYFRSAHGGTLFLDEVGELSLELQPKLLRVLESHEIQAVGSATTYKADVRVLAATNRDLRAMVKSGTFREDLYHRLSAINVLVPPLRKRTDGVKALAACFIQLCNEEFGKQIRFVSRRAIKLLESEPWTGNVRELGNALRLAAMLTSSDRLDIPHFPIFGQNTNPAAACREELTNGRSADSNNDAASVDVDESCKFETPPAEERDEPGAAKYSLREIADSERKKAMVRALSEAGGNYNRAAKLLGVSRFTVYRLAARYGLRQQ